MTFHTTCPLSLPVFRPPAEITLRPWPRAHFWLAVRVLRHSRSACVFLRSSPPRAAAVPLHGLWWDDPLLLPHDALMACGARSALRAHVGAPRRSASGRALRRWPRAARQAVKRARCARVPAWSEALAPPRRHGQPLAVAKQSTSAAELRERPAHCRCSRRHCSACVHSFCGSRETNIGDAQSETSSAQHRGIVPRLHCPQKGPAPLAPNGGDHSEGRMAIASRFKGSLNRRLVRFRFGLTGVFIRAGINTDPNDIAIDWATKFTGTALRRSVSVCRLLTLCRLTPSDAPGIEKWRRWRSDAVCREDCSGIWERLTVDFPCSAGDFFSWRAPVAFFATSPQTIDLFWAPIPPCCFRKHLTANLL
jgi:hypothetical protein